MFVFPLEIRFSTYSIGTWVGKMLRKLSVYETINTIQLLSFFLWLEPSLTKIIVLHDFVQLLFFLVMKRCTINLEFTFIEGVVVMSEKKKF